MTINTQDIIAAFAEAGKAMEANTRLEAEVERLNSMVENYAKQVQSTEISLLDKNKEIDELNAKLRSVEAERDSYGFRNIEADDLLSAERNKIAQVLAILVPSTNTTTVTPTPPVTPPEAAPLITPPPSKPYAGRRYSELTEADKDFTKHSYSGYPNHAEWLAGGGADEDYWR